MVEGHRFFLSHNRLNNWHQLILRLWFEYMDFGHHRYSNIVLSEADGGYIMGRSGHNARARVARERELN